jgi:peptidoglycan/xylan/chitin deacetylase (PgdA/CDA1 family)
VKKSFIASCILLVAVLVLLAVLKNQSTPVPVTFIPMPAVIENKIADKLWIPILVYHRIGIAPKNADSVYKSLTIEPDWFEKHLKYLKEHGFETVNYADVAAYFGNGTPLPIGVNAKPVMINFDDGYRGVYEFALPIMQKYNMFGTVFVITNSAGRSGYMTWDQLKIMRDAGVEMGSHTVWHPDLTKSLKAPFEITESKKRLETELGVPVVAFAYPSGKYNKKIEDLVKNAGYKLGRSYTTGNWIEKDKLFSIPVVKIYANVGLERWEKQLYQP